MLLNVTRDDRFTYEAEPITPAEWWMACNAREVTPEEAAEIAELTVVAKRLQELLRTIYERPEVELNGAEDVPVDLSHAGAHPWETHEYCSDCSECITCNLRPCRDGGAHKIDNPQKE